VATLYPLRGPAEDGFARFFEERVGPVMIEAGAPPVAAFMTETAENTFPRLPVRAGEHVFVWFASFPTAGHHGRHLARLAGVEAWGAAVQPELSRFLTAAPARLRLQPSSRSLLGRLSPPPDVGPVRGDVHDFDFIVGEWRVASRRLKHRGVGSGEWDEFPGTARAWPLLGGMANVDEVIFPSRGFAGMTVRAFDPAKRQWSIHWISSTMGVLTPPVMGGFTGDAGTFYGEDQDRGRPVHARFIWHRLGPDAARWEQAFWYEAGPWETNWVMELTRQRPPA
jgi:hypothetical protein